MHRPSTHYLHPLIQGQVVGAAGSSKRHPSTAMSSRSSPVTQRPCQGKQGFWVYPGVPVEQGRHLRGSHMPKTTLDGPVGPGGASSLL